MDASKTSDSYISISDDVINKSRNDLVFTGELDERILSELHATWKRKMIQAGVVNGTIETPSASVPTTPVITPLQAQDLNHIPGYGQSGIDINAQLPSTDLTMSIKNETSIKNEADGFHIPQHDGAIGGFYIPQLDGAASDGFYIRQQDGAASDGFYVPQYGGAIDGDIATTSNTYAPFDEDDEMLNENDDVEEDDINDDEDLPHLIMCQFDNVKKRKSKWDCKLKAGVMQINEKTILFSEAKGDFTF